MIARLGARLSRVAERFLPEPFALALLLTLMCAVIAATQIGPAETVSAWMTGFTSTPLLAFALQMCLVLITGHALATSPPVQRLVAQLAKVPKGPKSAAALVALVACLAAVVHWGLGAIVGAFLAREMGRHSKAAGIPVHYPLLGGAAYAGMAVWHGGLSGSAPLKVAEAGHFAEAYAGVIPVQSTLFSPLNAVVTLGLCVIIPLLFVWMVPPKEELVPPPDTLRSMDAPSTAKGLDRGLAILVGTVGLGGVGWAFAAGEASFDLNFMNFVFLLLGLLLQGSLRAYGDAVAEGARGAGAIIIQFPFYFGILGMLKEAGLVAALSETMVAVAGPNSFEPLAFLSAGLTNLVVPSGGGQWAVQGEVLLRSAEALQLDPAGVVMAFSYGDAWTNMLQPFWALPLLGIMGLRARDIVGYTAVVFLVMGVWVPLVLVLM